MGPRPLEQIRLFCVLKRRIGTNSEAKTANAALDPVVTLTIVLNSPEERELVLGGRLPRQPRAVVPEMEIGKPRAAEVWLIREAISQLVVIAARPVLLGHRSAVGGVEPELVFDHGPDQREPY